MILISYYFQYVTCMFYRMTSLKIADAGRFWRKTGKLTRLSLLKYP